MRTLDSKFCAWALGCKVLGLSAISTQLGPVNVAQWHLCARGGKIAKAAIRRSRCIGLQCQEPIDALFLIELNSLLEGGLEGYITKKEPTVFRS